MSNTSNTIILGDFNIHINKKNEMAYDLISLMESHSFKQLVMSITHTSGNTIDLVFLKDDASLNITMNPTNHLITDHYAISFTIQYPIRNKHINTLISYRNISRISISDYTKDLLTITIYTYYDITATKRNSYLTVLLDKHAPSKTKYIRNTFSNNVLFNANNVHYKKLMRIAERLFTKHPTAKNLVSLNDTRVVFKKSINFAKKCYYNNEIKKCGKSSKLLYKFTNGLMRKNKQNILPNIPSQQLSNDFSSFFISKIKTIRQNIITNLNNTTPNYDVYNSSTNSSSTLSSFIPPLN